MVEIETRLTGSSKMGVISVPFVNMKAINLFSILFLLLTVNLLSYGSAQVDTEDRKRRVVGPTAPVGVTWSKTRQVIEGFGISNAFNVWPNVGAFTQSQLDLLFSTDKGIGLTLLRAQIPEDGSCMSPSSGNATVVDPIACAGGANAVSDFQNLKALGVLIWAAPWSPPAIWKSSQSTIGGTLLPAHYGDYAQYLLNYAKNLKEVTGVDLYALSLQNEPSSHVSYVSCPYDPISMNNLIDNYVAPLFASTNIRLMMPETASYGQLKTIWQKSINSHASIVAFHGYDRHVPSINNPFSPKSFWQTEISGSLNGGKNMKTFDSSITDAIKWAVVIHKWIVLGGLNAWHFFWAQNHVGANRGPNQSLLSPNGTPAQRLYSLGNFAKFLRPGFVRIDTAPNGQQGVFVSAYRGPNVNVKQLAIIAINSNSVSVTQQFQLSLGFQITSIAPWLTANGIHLVQQPNVTVTSSSSPYDNQFTYNLPANSVITFYYE